MRTYLKLVTAVFVGVAFAACGDNQYDAALLQQYRTAVPDEAKLSADSPESTSLGHDLGDIAFYPAASRDIISGINGAVRGIVRLMRHIVDLPPTVYNSATKEFVWGPFKNDDDFGTVAAYIKENPEGSDFKYSYALLRGVDNDVAKMVPVIFGGATPDAEDPEGEGVGVTLWDFSANYDFAKAHDPNYLSKDFDKGRFVALYGKNAAADDADATFSFVVSVFRQFVPKDKPNNPPADLDYFYGRYVGEHTVSFVDFELSSNLDNSTPALEDLKVRMAFVRGQGGRAEASASGGSLAAGRSWVVTECFNSTLHETYLREQLRDGASTSEIRQLGAVNDCTPFFIQNLDEAGIPSLEDIDSKTRTALETVAENGIPK